MINFSPLFYKQVNVTGMNYVLRFDNLEIDTTKDNPFEIIGDPVLSDDPNNLIAIGPDFYHHAVDSPTIGDSNNLILFIQQTRKAMTFELSGEVSDTKVKEHVFKVEGGYESGSIPKLLFGSINLNFGYEYKKATEHTDTTSIGFVYTVRYPARKLKIRTKGASSNDIDTDE